MKYPKRSQYKHAKQKKYHVRNWAEYNEGLRRRGDLTVWFDEEAIANWMADKTGKPGGQRVYSDMAIETGLVVRMVYKLAYRQTEGFLHSIASLLGLGIEIPDYSTLSRRSRLLRKKLRIPKAASNQPIHLMIDSTGLRIHVGTARKPPKQRAWRKLHIAVDRETGNIVASELTASRARDATRVPALLTQIQAPLASVAADSAYDKEAIEAHSPGRRTRVVIPPQRNATLNQNSNTAMQERERHIRAIERHGRREWYKLSGCTKRSMVENAVYRYKAIIGPEKRTRTLARQRVEHRIGCEILNKMTALGMPDTYLRRVTLRPAQGGQRFAPGRATTPLESENPTSSMKDRMALAMIEAAEADGRLRAGGSVVEYTGGSTGVSLSLVCAVKGYPLHIVTSDAFSREKLDHMEILGARLEVLPSDGGGMTEKLTRDMVEAAAVLAKKPGRFWTDQLNNTDPIAAYQRMAEEIWTQTDGRIDGFVQSVGTAGSLRGVGEALRRHNERIRIVAVEPSESAVLSGGPTGAHKIDGVGAGFVVPLWRDDAADRIEQVSTQDSVDMAIRLASSPWLKPFRGGDGGRRS